MRYLWVSLSCLLFAASACAQEFDLLIKGGHVLDAKNQIDAKRDIAVIGDKVVKVAVDIPESAAKRVVDARGMIVAPGLIDVHAHVFVGNNPKTFADGRSSIFPDDYSFRAGITTVVDCGTSGWRNFPTFKTNVIDQAKTRVLAFLNIFGSGMIGSPQEQQLDDLDTQKVRETIDQNSDRIVGIKIGHYSGSDWMPFELALDVAHHANRPVIIEAHLPKLPLEGILNRMGPGDIYSQAFKHTTADRLSIVDDNGKVWPYVQAAYRKGVLFDVGHGGVSFQFSTAIPAFRQGITPYSFGSDLHSNSINGGMKDMLNIMSKYLNMGMSLKDVISRATWNSALSIKRNDLGHLSEGAVADLTVLRITKGKFGFIDANNVVMKGEQKLQCEVTVRAGKVVYDLNGKSSSKYANTFK